MTDTMTELWTAEQVCGDCGEGVFPLARFAICTECGHEHTLDTFNLDEGERFEFRLASLGGVHTLHVTSYAADPTDGEEI